MHTSAPPANRLQVLAAYAAVYVIWGSTYLAIRYAIETMPPFMMAGVRFITAGLLLYTWARWRNVSAPTKQEWWNASKVSVFIIVGGTSLVAWAEQWVPSGIAALILAVVPLCMILMEWVGPERIRPSVWALVGVAVGLIGIAILIGPSLITEQSDLHIGGTIALLISALLWTFGSLYSRRVQLPASATISNGIEMIAGGAISILIGLALGEHHNMHLERISGVSLLALAYLTIMGAVIAFSAYMWLLRVSSPSRVATHAYVNPVVAVALGWAIAGETVSSRTIVAMAVIVGAVILITSTSRD